MTTPKTTTNKTNNEPKTTKKVTTKKVTTENATKKIKVTPIDNVTKTTFSLNMSEFYNDFCNCKTKYDMVCVFTKYGIYTSTDATTTNNSNDLYLQFFDKSRIKLNSKSFQIYTCDDTANELIDICKKSNITVDNASCNDGSYRKRKLTFNEKTEKTLECIFKFFNEKTILFSNLLKVEN